MLNIITFLRGTSNTSAKLNGISINNSNRDIKHYTLYIYITEYFIAI